MLATLTDKYFSDPGWIYERKFDGERVVGFRDGDGVTLRSRTGRALDRTYPELVDALRAQATADFVIDGEVVAFEGSRTSFERLQQRIGITDPDQAVASGVAVYYYVFDLLRLDGADVTGQSAPGSEAVAARRDLVRWSVAVHHPPQHQR